MFCPRCGSKNSEGASFCIRCGVSLIADQSEPAATTMSYALDEEHDAEATLAGLADQTACLVIRSGGGRAGETYPLKGPRVTIGRHRNAMIFLDDVTVSRRHAAVIEKGDTWVLTDEGSLNGTYVNRERSDRTLLRDGDEIQIGKFRLTFLGP